jgi:CAAX protease family protein
VKTLNAQRPTPNVERSRQRQRFQKPFHALFVVESSASQIENDLSQSPALGEGRVDMTTADNASQRQGAARGGLLARYPLIFYFVIAYGFSWVVWVPLALSKDGAGLLSFRSPIGASASVVVASFVGPFLSAFIMTGITEGREGIDRLLRRCVLWRVGLGWYLFALIGIPLILALGVIALPGAMASFTGLASLAPPRPWLSLIIYVFFHGPLGEEPGWRGFALPRLQRLYGPLVGSLILGTLWPLWHLPYFWVPAWNFPPTLLNVGLFVISSIPLTIVMTWVFNNTKGSVLMAILVHLTFDFTFVILNLLFTAPIVTDYGSTLPVFIGLGAVALLLIILTRGQLGYEHSSRSEQ